SDALQAIAAHGKRRVALLLERGALGGKKQRQRVDICQNGTHSGVRAAAIASSSAGGSCAPETAVRPLKMKNGTPVIPASCASRYSASTSARQASEASAACASSRGRPQSAASAARRLRSPIHTPSMKYARNSRSTNAPASP